MNAPLHRDARWPSGYSRPSSPNETSWGSSPPGRAGVSPATFLLLAQQACLKTPAGQHPLCGRDWRVEAIEVHYLGPRRREVRRKLLFRIRAGIHLRERAELRVRTEDQVDARTGPL